MTDRLIRQRQASPHTVAAYRDAFKLLLAFAGQRTGKSPSKLEVADLDAPLIGAFLEHLETERGNSARTRNARLAAIHSLFRYAALRHPEDAATIQRVLAIPPKRFDSRYWLPRSLWWIAPATLWPARSRADTAISSASRASDVRMCPAAFHPAIRRENAPVTKAT